MCLGRAGCIGGTLGRGRAAAAAARCAPTHSSARQRTTARPLAASTAPGTWPRTRRPPRQGGRADPAPPRATEQPRRPRLRRPRLRRQNRVAHAGQHGSAQRRSMLHTGFSRPATPRSPRVCARVDSKKGGGLLYSAAESSEHAPYWPLSRAALCPNKQRLCTAHGDARCISVTLQGSAAVQWRWRRIARVPHALENGTHGAAPRVAAAQLFAVPEHLEGDKPERHPALALPCVV